MAPHPRYGPGGRGSGLGAARTMALHPMCQCVIATELSYEIASMPPSDPEPPPPLPQVVHLTDKLLKKLLAAHHPSLYWSRACARALLGECVSELSLGPFYRSVPVSFCLQCVSAGVLNPNRRISPSPPTAHDPSHFPLLPGMLERPANGPSARQHATCRLQGGLRLLQHGVEVVAVLDLYGRGQGTLQDRCGEGGRGKGIRGGISTSSPGSTRGERGG